MFPLPQHPSNPYLKGASNSYSSIPSHGTVVVGDNAGNSNNKYNHNNTMVNVNPTTFYSRLPGIQILLILLI